MSSEPLSKRIRRLRSARSMTLQNVADKVGGITPAAVSHWESGRTEPTPDNLQRLAKVLGVSVQDLRGPAAAKATSHQQSDVNAAIDEILEEAERRIAALIERPSEQVTVSYTVSRHD